MVAKVVADQVVFAPVLLTTLFYSMARMEGRAHDVGVERVSSTLLGALQMNWTVWPVITAANTTLVPAMHRAMVVNMVCIPWSAYLAYKNNLAKKQSDAAVASVASAP